MALTENSLRNVDHEVLDYLNEGRVTPSFLRGRLAKDEGEEFTRSYIQQRLKRFEEHGHVTNLDDSGLYELKSDPREGDDDT